MSCGWELQNAANAAELYGNGFTGTPGVIDTTIKRSGAASYKISALSSGVGKGQICTSTQTSFANGTSYWLRFYLYIVTLPSATTTIGGFSNTINFSSAATAVRVRLGSDGKLQLVHDSAPTLVSDGFTPAALNTGQWYRVEVQQKRDATPNAGNDEARLYLDGALQTGGAGLSIPSQASGFMVGGNCCLEAQSAGEWYVDDVAINDDTGTAQNGLPGAGSIVHLLVNGAGEFAQTLVNTTGETNAYEAVDEMTFDDATSYVTFTDNATTWTGTGSRAMFACANMPESPTSVNCVSVGVRFANLNTSGSNFSIGCQIANGGTRSEVSIGNFANATTWFTHDFSSNAKLYRLTLYTDPDSAAWTETTLNSLQIGARATDAAPDVHITQMWALVDYVPTPVVPPSGSLTMSRFQTFGHR